MPIVSDPGRAGRHGAEGLWQRLLGRPASERGGLCRGDRAQGATDAAGEC